MAQNADPSQSRAVTVATLIPAKIESGSEEELEVVKIFVHEKSTPKIFESYAQVTRVV